MNLVWIVIIIMAVGFLGAGFVFSKEKLPRWVQDLFLTGWEFFLVGFLIGPGGLAIIKADHLEQLDPFIALGLGWAGLIFGAQMRFFDLKKIDIRMKRVTILQSLAVICGSFILFALGAVAMLPLTWTEVVMASGVVAAAAAISSPTAISLMAPRIQRSKAPVLRSLMIISTLDVGPSLILLGCLFSFFPADPNLAFSFEQGIWMMFYSTIIAAALAGLFWVFERSRTSDAENLALVIGFIIFISGIAFYLNISALFLSLFVGVFLANLLPPDDNLHKSLHTTEKPFYVIMLIVAGMWWDIGGAPVWLLAVFIVGARLWLKRVAVDISSKFFLITDSLPEGVGLALSAQGALAIAIGLSYVITYHGPGPQLAFGVIAIAVMINEAISPYLISRTLMRNQ